MTHCRHFWRAVFALLLCLASSRVQAASVMTGFSPGGTAQQVVLVAIGSAQVSIDMAAYSFTSKPVATALLAAQGRGVSVRVVADRKANSKYTAVTFLANQGVPVRLNDRYAAMHHKFMVIDGRSVQVGSYNYSVSAHARNAENALWLQDMPLVAADFSREFARLWDEGEPVLRRY
ncbi:phospholipase D (plasmid) [Serratia marcescens]|uniref:phospholipase D family nuclease n=1 Tax=Serratia marcescens TaxID=615 RepID=UPI003A84557F|nr:phospholipase D [Serratia marcescens]